MSRSRIRRTSIKVATLLLLLLLAGATYQGVATALERRQFPRPGRMVDVGGHQLHIHCLGEGAPIVVLEAPAAGMSASWGWVQPEVAKVTRVCSYDRAGQGWSENSDRPDSAAMVAAELHTLLDRAGEHGPYVIAGQGIGAAFATLFAAAFDRDTAALILVDTPDTADVRPGRTRISAMSPWLARSGILRGTRMLSSRARGLPPVSAGALGAFLNRPDHLTRAVRELSQWDDVMALTAQASLRPGLPVTRLVAAGTDRIAFLVREQDAAPVTAAILATVAELRRK